VVYSRDNNQFPTTIDVFAIIVLLIALLGTWWAPAINLAQQNNNPVTVANATQFTAPVVIIEIVFDTAPTQAVTINNIHAMYQYYDNEGYHLIFIVPTNKTYVLSPACCSRTRYLTPRKYYAFWLGECVAIRTDK
jgi:hypothetical protein